MSSRKRNRNTGNDENMRPSKRPRMSKSQAQSQKVSQFPGMSGEDNAFRTLMHECKVRFRSNFTKPHELDAPESIQYYLQRKLFRDASRRKQFVEKFEDFIEAANGKRLNQLLLPTIPRKNNATKFISSAWQNMSQINENEIECISTRSKTQPSIVRILLNVDCLQTEIIQLLTDKLDEYISDETRIDLVLQILHQFKFLDHLVGDKQSFTANLFTYLDLSTPLNTKIQIISLFDEIIHDEQHEFVAVKLQNLLETDIELTRPIIECLTQLKISPALKEKTQTFLLDSLQASHETDLDIIIRYLLRTVNTNDVETIISAMRQNIPFNTIHNLKIFAAFQQCIDVQKHVSNAILTVLNKINNSTRLTVIDIWLLFILYDGYQSKVQQLMIKKIEAGVINDKYISDSIAIEKYNGVNIECLLQVFDSVLFLAQSMLESKSAVVSKCGELLYKILYRAMGADGNDKYQSKLISSITSSIGSGTQIEVNNSLRLLLQLTLQNHGSIKRYQTQIMLLCDYIESFNNSQVRLLYKIISLLSIHIDSNHELQIGNNLMNLVTKQLAHSGFLHQQQAGIVGCIQLIYTISTKYAVHTTNAIENANNLVKKIVNNAHKNVQLFAIFCDELSLMIEHSRNYNQNVISWNEYTQNQHENDIDNDFKMEDESAVTAFYPIHKDVLKELYETAKDMISESWVMRSEGDGSQSMITQQPQFERNDLKPQMWLNLSGRKPQIRNSSGIDSEATEYTTDNDDTSNNKIYFRIAPIFVAQDSQKLMWVFSPLFRLFGILCNAFHGDLERIDSFLTAPLVMFDATDLQRRFCIDKGKITRQIMGDSIFSAINCIAELLNMFCSEYVQICRNEMEHNHNANNNDISQPSHRRLRKLETRLCHRLDHLVCLQSKLETFMSININKQFLPSFIPSKNKQQTWLNSPPWKRKMLSFDKKKKKKVGERKDNLTMTDDDDGSNDKLMIDSEEDNEDNNDRNKNKKKKSPKKQLSKKKKKRKAAKKKKKKPVKAAKVKSKKSKTKSSDTRSALTKVEPYFRALDLSVSVLLQFEILDRNYFKRALRRCGDVSTANRHFTAMISLKGFHFLLRDFCNKAVEIVNNQSARKGFVSKEVTESIIEYTPVLLLQRYGFIFGFIAKQIYSLITFIQTIHGVLEDDRQNQEKVAHFRTLPALIEDCFAIFIQCLTKLFKYKQFELVSNKKIFDSKLLKNLYNPDIVDDDDEDMDDLSFTEMSVNLIKMLEKICGFVQDLNVAVKILCLMEIILKNSRFDSETRSDYKAKIKSICCDMLLGRIGDGYMGQIKNASNVGQIVSFYLKNCENERESLQEVAECYKVINSIEDRNINKWHSLLNKKTISHFLKPMLECTTSLYGSYSIGNDVGLAFHTKCIAHFNELTKIISSLATPKTTGYVINSATIMFTKCMHKISKFVDNHNAKHIVSHLNQIEIVSRMLHRVLYRVQKKCGQFNASDASKKQWLSVADKIPKLKSILDEWLLKSKMYLHSTGRGHSFDIRSLKSERGLEEKKIYKLHQNEEQENDEDEDEEDEYEDDSDDDESSESESDE